MNQFLEALQTCGGYWEYKDGKKYLAELTSGKISDVFANTGVITSSPLLMGQWVPRLCREITEGLENIDFHVVCVPAVGGITLGYVAADYLNTSAYFTEKVDGIQTLKRFSIPDGFLTIFFEDVITTGKSLGEMIASVRRSITGETGIYKTIGCLINRSGEDLLTIDGIEFEIISLAEVNARVWNTLEDAQKDCPSVIEAVKPKLNWEKLTQG